jgi:hypothetical protein
MINFSTDVQADKVAGRAAQMFLPRRQGREFLCTGDWGAQINLNFPGDTRTRAQLKSKLTDIADGAHSYRTLRTEAEQGRAVLRAIADAIFPALNTGSVGRTEMARAAALEIAVAIANRSNLTIGMRAALAAVNARENATKCQLGLPSEFGIDIHAGEKAGRVYLCESTAWDAYHWTGDAGAPTKAAGKRSETATAHASSADSQAGDVPNAPCNIRCQDRRILIADVCTSFTVKTDEWWLTRKLLPRRTQRATVGAKIERVHFESPDRRLQEALAYENGTARHVACNWLARLCRFMRAIRTTKARKSECLRELAPARAIRRDLRIPDLREKNLGLAQAQSLFDNCPLHEIKRAELVDDDARRVGRRSGTWSDSARYHGKLDLSISFQPDAPVEPKSQTVALGVLFAARKPAYHAYGEPGRHAVITPRSGSAEPPPSRPRPSVARGSVVVA